MSAQAKIPVEMTVEEFLAWDAPPPLRWQLVDGEPRAMAPASRTHGTIQSQLSYLIRRHLEEHRSPCAVVNNPGVVPHVQPSTNFRIPDLAVTCTSYETEESVLTDPVLVIEILSPSNKSETWANVFAYTTIPSVHEILVVETEKIGAKLLRRNADGTWPKQPTVIEAGDVTLESIGVSFSLATAYRTTRLH